MSIDALLSPITPSGRLLTAAQFQHLGDVPPENEWFANLGNLNTRRAYENAIKDFMQFTGIARPDEFRVVTRAHVIAWRDELVPRFERHDDTAPPGGAVVAVRIPLREKRRHP